MFYENSITEIRSIISKVSGPIVGQEANLIAGEKAPVTHLFWMCNQIEAMNTSDAKNAAKAGRWIGWVFAHMEMHGFLTNKQVRNLSRSDVQIGNDVPH